MDQSEGIRKVYRERALPDALTSFQFIEEELKEIVLKCHRVIKKSTDGKLDYSYSEESVRKAALDTLIKWFKCYCSDVDLVDSLNKMREHRNRFAHRGYLEILNASFDELTLRKELNSLASVISGSKNIHEKLKSFNERLSELA